MTDETRQERAAAAKAGKGAPPRASAGTSRPGRGMVRSRPDRYLIAAVPPADVRAITSQLEDDQSCRVIRILSGPGSPGGFPGVAAVEMTPEHAAMLAAYPGIHAEPDRPAGHGRAPAVQPPAAVTRRVMFEVLDDSMRPIEGATVTLAGTSFPVTGFTGPDGRTEITVTPEALTAPMAEIHPPRGCWPVRVRRPLIDQTGPVRVACTRITTTYPEFPERALDSWGARVMGFGRLPPTYRGNGVRIALIDSGAATGHPDLSGQLEHGRDLIGRDEKGWQEDLIGTGTHHATLIAGRDDGTGIVGLAPEAEVHICRTSPGGSVADMIEALDYCIEQQVDVAMFGSCIPEQSALLAAKVEEAWRNGIACIAATGDSAGGDPADGVCWPAALPQVLAVNAIGQLGTFPPEGADTATLTARVTPEGFFVPAFGSGGAPLSAPDCCAPGVAVISGLPPASYGPLSGTGTAAAHVTALAALILAHHPLFRLEPGQPTVIRDSARPARLLEVIKGSCRPLPQLDPAQTGAGIPDVAVALGVAPWGTYPPLSMPYPAPAPTPDGRTPLEPLSAAMRAAGLIAGDKPPGRQDS